MSENELNEFREIRRKILELIGQAKTERAISLLKEFLEAKNPTLHSKLVLISNRFHDLKLKQTLGLSFEESHLNDVNYDLINFVNGLEPKLLKTKDYKPKFLSKKSLGVIGLSLTGIFLIWMYFKNFGLSTNKHYPTEALSLTPTLSNDELIDPETNPNPTPIRFSIDNGKNILKLVYYDKSIKRNDTFEINTDWQIYDLKQEIIRHYKPNAYNPLLFCRGEPLYYRGEGGEYISLSLIMKKGDIKEFDKIRINPGGLASIEENSSGINAENLIACHPLHGDDMDYFKISIPTSRGISVELSNRVNLNNENSFTNYSGNFGQDNYSISPQLKQNQNKDEKRKNKKYIVTSRFGIIEENEIFIVRESDEQTKYGDEEE